MANSKVCSDGVIDLKVHYNYHGNQRCGLVDCNYGEMFGMTYLEFENMLRCEIPYLNRLAVMRISIMDDEKTYIDLNERNYHRFLKLAVKTFTDDTPKVNLKIVEGSSPLIVEKSEAPPRAANNVGETPRPNSRRVLQYDSDEFVQTYRSPIEIDINLKKRELELKETEFGDVKAEYDSKYNDFHPSGIYGDQSKSVCSRCHLRLEHSRNRLYDESDSRVSFGPKCNAGDRIGCGVKGIAWIFYTVVFTRNGKKIGEREFYAEGLVYPAIGMHSAGEKVKVILDAKMP